MVVRGLAAGVLALAAAVSASGQELPAVPVDHLPTSLAGDWLFRTGHDPAWASPFRERRSWYRIHVPGAWERNGYPGYNGHAWYRVQLVISSQLAGEELGVDLGMIGDADEVFLNGRKIGSTGSPPPRFDKATLARRFYPLPREAIRFGEHNELAIHVYNGTRFGGLLGPAPRIDRWDRLLRFMVLRDLLDFSFATLLFTLAMFHLALFLAQRDAFEHATFAAFLLAAGLHFLTYANWGPAYLLGHSANFRLSVVTFLLAITLLPPTIYRLAHRHLPVPIIAGQTVLALGAVFAVVWRDEGDLYFWVYLGEAAAIGLAALTIAILASLARQRHPWARRLLYATVFLLATVAVDILVDLGLIPRTSIVVGELYTPFGLAPFAVLLSLALAFSWVERRWGEPRDFATGLISRDRFASRLRDELLRARRTGSPSTVALLRIELLERSRDRDQLLLAAVEALKRALRQIDLLARHEPETLAILLAETDERGAISTLERLRHIVAECMHDTQIRVRTTAGVVQYRPGRHTGGDELLAEAEAALYAALSEGGDCTTTAP
jgi:diguanylate cyclase (GGDEF)-like protein